jgi:epoxyqueuosine reductase
MAAGGRRGGLSDALRAEAGRLGFGLVGVTRPEPSGHIPFYRRWIAEGHHGEMAYLARRDAVERRADLTSTLDGIRSVVVVGHEYYQDDPQGVPVDPARGVIARYARGRVYHKVVGKKVASLGRWLEGAVGGTGRRREEGVRGGEGDTESGGVGRSVSWRAYVDTGPILERDLARRAGLGWLGKNTMLIHPRKGSYFFLGVLLCDVELEADAPFTADHCGTCTACLDACPTGALLGRDETGAPVMDARRCISYLTIEHRGAIPEDLRSLLGNRVFGCDICQEVCPWNVRFAEVAAERHYAPREARAVERDANPGEADVSAETSGDDPRPTRAVIPTTDGPALIDLVRMSEDEWDAFTRGSATRRAGYGGLRRNVAVALGNWIAGSEVPDPDAVGELVKALSDEDPVVAEAAAWGLGRARGTRQRPAAPP